MKLVIIPTYNEKDNIAGLIELIYRVVPDIHILIVDDNSPDGTGSFIQSLMANRYQGRLFLILRPGKLGLGTAYVTGFKWALAKDYQYVLEMDADFSHNPKYLKTFLNSIEECDLVLGSRYVSGGGIENWGLFRRIISKGGSLYSRIILGMPFYDLTGGYKCFRREVLAEIDLDNIKSNGYSFQIEMTYRAFLQGFRIREIPIVFEERAAGRSKMSCKIFLEAVIMVWKLRASRARIQPAAKHDVKKIQTSAMPYLLDGRSK